MPRATVQGTLIQLKSQVALMPTNYFLGKAMVIITNDVPTQFQYPNTSFVGFFKTLEDLKQFYPENSSVYKLATGLLTQTGRNNIANVDYRFGVLYVDGKNATNSYIATENIADRLSNFAPTSPALYKKCVLSIEIDDVVQTKTFTIFKPITSIDILCQLLNDADFNCSFTIENSEIKVEHPYLGAGHNISIIEAPSSYTDAGYVDLSGEKYLNLLSETMVEGENDEGNSGSDYINAISNLLNITVRENGKEYKIIIPVTSLATTAKVRAATVKTWDEQLVNFSQNSLYCRYLPIQYVTSSKAENTLLAEITAYQLSFVSTGTEGFADEDMRLALTGAHWASACSVDYGSRGDGMRNDPEWGYLSISSKTLKNDIGLSNAGVNDVVENGIGDVFFYDYDKALMFCGGCSHGWSTAEIYAYSALAEEIMNAIKEGRVTAIDKTKSLASVDAIKTDVGLICSIFRENNYITKEIKDDNPILATLTSEQRTLLKTDGYCIDNPRFVNNNITFDLYVCLQGIIARIFINQKVSSN